MHRLFLRALRLGELAVLLILLGAGTAGMSAPVQAAESYDGELYFMVFPENDDVTYACVGEPFQGFFMAGIEKEASNPDPLAPLVPPEIHVNTDTPKVGTLSQSKWTVKPGRVIRFTYTPTKVGDEDLLFDASIPNSSYKPITTEGRFPVLNCHYKLSIQSQIDNIQGGIKTAIFYDANGHFDLLPQKNYPLKIKGYGETKFLATTNGTEGDVTCVTTEPAEASGTLEVEGQADPDNSLLLTLRFSDTGSGAGPQCKKGNKTGVAPIRYYGWLPTGKQEGVLQELRFAVGGDSVTLGINAFNDRRWVQGTNSGIMLIEVEPVKK